MQEYAHSHGYELANQFFRAATPVHYLSDDVSFCGRILTEERLCEL
jgi:hypothetical protein